MINRLVKTTGVAACALFASLASHSVFAKQLTDAQTAEVKLLQQTALQSNLAYDLDESLTTEVGARMIGTEGDRKSVAWAIDKMKALGFDRVWTEEANYIPWIRGEEKASIVKPYPQKLVVTALGGSVATPESGIEAPVVHFENLDALKKAEAGSLKGKIAFISERMERHKTGKGYGKAVGGRSQGAIAAAEKGALALVIRSIGTDNDRVAHTGMMRYDDKITKIPAAALSNPDADMLERQISRGKEVVIALKLDTKRLVDEPITTSTVIGELTGSEIPEEFVIMAAHLDSWDVGTGAVDDGIGVGITMAAAAHIAKLPARPKRSIRVILWAGEEVGLVGVKQYVKDHQHDMDKHIIGAEWDFGTHRIYKMTPGVGPKALYHIDELAGLLAPLGISQSPENNAKGQSDLSLLGKAGMPAINFHVDGIDYFDVHHTENDTLDKVDPEAMKHGTAVYVTFSYFAAQSGIDFRK